MLGRQLGNMYQTFLARQNLNESTKVHQTGNFTGINLANLSFGSNAFDHLDSLISSLGVNSSDKYATGIIDINLSAGFVNNLLDHLAARSDNLSNLIRIYMDSSNLRSILGQLFARFADAFHHFAHDEFTAAFSLCQSLGEDILVDTVNLNIHLDSSNTFFGTCNLEVHIAQSILQTLDISQNSEVFAILNKAHSNAGNRSLNRNACIHQGQGACANRAHGGGTVGFQNLGYQTDCIRELLFGRNNRTQSALSQSTVTDFAAARAAQRFGFAYAVRREVVVMDITLGFLSAKTIKNLCFTQRSQSQNVQNLSLTTGEQRAAMRTSQQANLAAYRTYFV